MTIKIISWNILHIVHEFNYVEKDSLVINEYPNELARMEKILEVINNEIINNEEIIVNLQEVPGDYLEKLISSYKENIYFYTYSRIPTLKTLMTVPYKNMKESLVSIVKVNQKVLGQTFIDFYKGKAALILKFASYELYNVHLPIKYDKVIKIEHNAIIVGDFNCNQFNALKIFHNCAACENYENTHIIKKNNQIILSALDHILYKGIKIKKIAHVEKSNLSDHYPIYTYIYE